MEIAAAPAPPKCPGQSTVAMGNWPHAQGRPWLFVWARASGVGTYAWIWQLAAAHSGIMAHFTPTTQASRSDLDLDLDIYRSRRAGHGRADSLWQGGAWWQISFCAMNAGAMGAMELRYKADAGGWCGTRARLRGFRLGVGGEGGLVGPAGGGDSGYAGGWINAV